MLRKTRVLIAAAVLTLMSLLFVDFTGTLHPWLGWLVRIQLVPALLSAKVGVAVAVPVVLVVAAALFGRIYCSLVCPLGIMQDCIISVSNWRRGPGRFHHKKPIPWLRYVMLALFALGGSVAVSLLDPYAGFGRIVSNLFAPLYRLGNNLLAWIAEAFGGYAFYTTDVWVGGWPTFIVAALTFVLVGTLAWRGGRTWCNTACPVGTLLGLFSRLSVFRTAIKAGKCTNCGLCEKGCKASCIDTKNMTVDQSRCVRCFNCTENCKQGGFGYTFALGKKRAEKQIGETGADQADATRRSVMVLLWSIAAANVANVLKAQRPPQSSQPPQPQQYQPLQAEGGLAKLTHKKTPARKVPIVPPGAQGLHNVENNCSACQLCVSSCPNGVLRPSNRPAAFMQPEMSFEQGFCRPECVECSLLCPSNVIRKVTRAEKACISIGYVVWDKERCLVNADNVPCTSCERRCPTEAIKLVERDPGVANSLKVPVIDNDLCIGCGACEYHCPVRPYSAIRVEGHEQHHTIEFEEQDGHGKRKRKQQ